MFPETIIQKISATDSSFHAKYRTKQKVQFLLVVLYNEVIKTNSNLFIFFFEKVLSVKKKHSEAKIKKQFKIKQTRKNKGNIFYGRKNLKFVFFVFVLFQRSKRFR